MPTGSVETVLEVITNINDIAETIFSLPTTEERAEMQEENEQ